MLRGTGSIEVKTNFGKLQDDVIFVVHKANFGCGEYKPGLKVD